MKKRRPKRSRKKLQRKNNPKRPKKITKQAVKTQTRAVSRPEKFAHKRYSTCRKRVNALEIREDLREPYIIMCLSEEYWNWAP